MGYNPQRRARVNMNPLPLFDWAEADHHRTRPISPLAHLVRKRWGYGPEAAKAAVMSWGFEGGLGDA